ncbi:MAG: hypothetical protein ACFFDN_37550 [Candidatus Hodarchaeota archaeon]
MSETIAVLFIFFVLIVFGIIFYYKYSEVSFEQKQEELLGRRAMEVTLQTLFLPELICSQGEAEPEDNCIDLLKIDTAQKVFKDYFSEYYFDLFPYTKIMINQTYPEEKGWVLYDKPKPDWTRLEQTFFVVALRDQVKGKKQTGEYGFGYITVGSYS